VVRRALRAYVTAGSQGRQLDLEDAVAVARKRKR
jgi:hypothetical protein